jgi:hypothetical protein
MRKSFDSFSRALIIAVFILSASIQAAAQSLPKKVSDKEFWSIVVGFSEPSGSFVSDNIISNEIEFQRAIPEIKNTPQHGVYIGVGPEQNFTYITAFKPAIAFIVDIRRGNLLLHLTYKALIEMSAGRLDFMSRLFARTRPLGVQSTSTARELFDAFGSASFSDGLARVTLAKILDRLERTHGFPLSQDDRSGIAEVYRSLYSGGPHVRGDFGGGSWIPSYAELMATTDLTDRNHAFLESEENFGVLKQYESNNLIVPLVGDFGGDHTIRAIGRYAKDHNAAVTTFYTSNVEEYLFKAGSSASFFANVSALPFTPRSMFIRAFFTHTNAGLRTLVDPIGECLTAVVHGDIRTYSDLITRSKTPKP